MNEVARTGFAESELKAPREEKVVPVTARGISNEDTTLNGWSKDQLPGPDDPRNVWPPERSFHSSDQVTANTGPDGLSAASRVAAVPVKPARIAIKTKGKILLISPADILSVEAEGNYVVLHGRSNSYSLRGAISNLAETLKDYGFVRIHRSMLVNSAWVEEIFPGPTGEYTLRVAGGKQYVVSRTYKPNLKWLAQSWIGTDSFADD